LLSQLRAGISSDNTCGEPKRGLYSSRSKGKTRQDGSLEKFGFGMGKEVPTSDTPEKNPVEIVSKKQAKSSWARLMVRL